MPIAELVIGMASVTFDHFQAEELRKTIESIVGEIRERMSSVLATEDMLMNWVSEATPHIQQDLARYVATDPAASGSYLIVHQTYAAFRAVATYRIAHAI